jgi:hypothetical protein
VRAFARTRLAVGEDRAIVALHAVVEHSTANRGENLLLRCGLIFHAIKRKLLCDASWRQSGREWLCVAVPLVSVVVAVVALVMVLNDDDNDDDDDDDGGAE